MERDEMRAMTVAWRVRPQIGLSTTTRVTVRSSGPSGNEGSRALAVGALVRVRQVGDLSNNGTRLFNLGFGGEV